METFKHLQMHPCIPVSALFCAPGEMVEAERRTLAQKMCMPPTAKFRDLLHGTKKVWVDKYHNLKKVKKVALKAQRGATVQVLRCFFHIRWISHEYGCEPQPGPTEAANSRFIATSADVVWCEKGALRCSQASVVITYAADSRKHNTRRRHSKGLHKPQMVW